MESPAGDKEVRENNPVRKNVRVRRTGGYDELSGGRSSSGTRGKLQLILRNVSLYIFVELLK